MLQVSPNSKLSTAKWRQQALGHLERLLAIKVSSSNHTPATDSRGNAEDVEVGSELPYHSIDDSMYMCMSNLEEYSIRYVTLLRFMLYINYVEKNKRILELTFSEILTPE